MEIRIHKKIFLKAQGFEKTINDWFDNDVIEKLCPEDRDTQVSVYFSVIKELDESEEYLDTKTGEKKWRKKTVKMGSGNYKYTVFGNGEFKENEAENFSIESLAPLIQQYQSASEEDRVKLVQGLKNIPALNNWLNDPANIVLATMIRASVPGL